MTPNQWNRNTRDSVVRLLTQAGFSEDSSVINQLECMNFDEPAEVPYALRQWAMDDEPESTLFDEGYNAARGWVRMQLEKPAEPTEQVEVVAYRVSHPLAQWKVYEQRQAWAHREYEHIRYEVQELMTVEQHKRIMASQPQSDAVMVPRELANRLVSTDNHVRQTARRELRNSLLGGDK